MKQFVILLSSILLLAACHSKTGEKTEKIETPDEEEGLVYQIEKYSAKYHMFNDSEKPYCSIYLTIPRITAGLGGETQAFVKQAINNTFFSENNGGVLLDEKFKIEAEQILADYKELENDFSDKQGEISSSFNWTIEHTLEIFEENDHFLTFRLSKFENTGAAKPSMKTKFLVLDLTQQKEMNLRNTFNPDKESQLLTLIMNGLRSQFATAEDFELNVWTENVKITNNFYVKDSTFTFYYNPNEIGAPSQGPLQVDLSYEEVKDVLNSKFSF